MALFALWGSSARRDLSREGRKPQRPPSGAALGGGFGRFVGALASHRGITYNTDVVALRVVLDTNVLVAALRSRRGASFRAISEIGRRRFDFVLSVPLVLEYEQAFMKARPPGVSQMDTQAFLNYLSLEGRLQEVFYLWRPHLHDPKDDMVLEAAVAGKCEAIVTHNRRHFGGAASFGITVLSPAEFLVRLGV